MPPLSSISELLAVFQTVLNSSSLSYLTLGFVVTLYGHLSAIEKTLTSNSVPHWPSAKSECAMEFHLTSSLTYHAGSFSCLQLWWQCLCKETSLSLSASTRRIWEMLKRTKTLHIFSVCRYSNCHSSNSVVISSLTLDQVVLPQLASFESCTIAVLLWRRIYWIFLSHSCAEIDLVFKLTSAGKIKIVMTCFREIWQSFLHSFIFGSV